MIDLRSASKRSVIIDRWQSLLDKLGVNLQVCWIPSNKEPRHGEIKVEEGILFIYDEDAEGAESTFLHEVIEHRLKELTVVYQATINALIEAIQKIIYSRKETFIESLPLLIESIQKARAGDTK